MNRASWLTQGICLCLLSWVFPLLLSAQSPGENLFKRLQSPDPVPVNVHQDARVAALLDRFISLNRNKKGMEGYRIQVYHGTGHEARKKAQAVQARFMAQFPDIPCYLIYQEPYFKIRVGDFRNRIEAYQVYRGVSGSFPDAFLVSDNEIQFPPLLSKP